MFGGEVLGKVSRCGCSTWTLYGCSSDSKEERRRITSAPIWHHWKTCPPCSAPMTMLNLDKTHPGDEKLLKGNGISVNRSSIPSSRKAVDITVEQTINKVTKEAILASAQTTLLTIGGIQLGILEPALCKPLELAEMDTTESCSHKDVRHCKISQSVEATGKVVKAITNFINPFDVYDNDNLYCPHNQGHWGRSAINQ